LASTQAFEAIFLFAKKIPAGSLHLVAFPRSLTKLLTALSNAGLSIACGALMGTESSININISKRHRAR
jgi:hypothetical protein